MSLLADLVKQDFGISGHDRWLRSDMHSSLVVDTEKDLFYFNARDLRGNAVDYLMSVRGFKRKDAEEFVKKVKTVGTVEKLKHYGIQARYDKLIDVFHSAGKLNRDYWYKRCLTDITIDRYRLGFYDDWFLIPIYDEGRFANFQCRRDIPEKKINLWYKDPDFHPILFNSDILKFVKSVFITEGMVDCILMNQLGFPTVCTTNGSNTWNSGWIKFFTNINEVMYIADNDKAGIIAANSVANGLGTSRTRVFRFKDKEEKYDVVNYFQDGGTKEGLKELMNINSVYGFEAGYL